MRVSLQLIFLSAFACLRSAPIAFAQTPAPAPSPVLMEAGVNRPMPSLTANPLRAETLLVMQPVAVADPSDGRQQTSPNLYPPPKEWPKPVEHNLRYLFLLADVLEFRPRGPERDFRWDIEGWYGGDFNRLWFKSEGEQSAVNSDNQVDFQLLYGRFIRRYWDFQIGGRVETKTSERRTFTRGHAVIGLEGFAPYRFDIESALFISHRGDVSGRLTFTRDLLLTQKLILQPRFETNFAIQEVKKFTVGRGLNNIELGLRLRYEIRRELAPYIGVSFERSLFGTADLVRKEGGDPSNVGFVAGVRLWW